MTRGENNADVDRAYLVRTTGHSESGSAAVVGDPAATLTNTAEFALAAAAGPSDTAALRWYRQDAPPTECGTPQGGVISPLLANLYLDPLDHQMAATGWEMVRYADDFVILCRTEAEAHAALAAVRAGVATAGLALHPEKTQGVDLSACHAQAGATHRGCGELYCQPHGDRG